LAVDGDDLVEQVVHIAARVVVRVLAHEDDPHDVLVRMECDDGAPGAAQAADAELVQMLAGHPVVQGGAGPDRRDRLRRSRRL
jgi:hypothetical protein